MRLAVWEGEGHGDSEAGGGAEQASGPEAGRRTGTRAGRRTGRGAADGTRRRTGAARRGRRGGERAGPAGAGHRLRARIRPGRGIDADHAGRRPGLRLRVRRDRGAARGRVGTLPAGAPAEAWAHLALYRARPDAAAIARAQPASAFAVAATVSWLVPLHGQAAWLGESVPVHDDAVLLRSPEQAERAAGCLPDRRGAAAARQRRPHPGRHTGPRGGPDVAARGRL